MDRPPVILDTNVFVAAGFNPCTASARLLRQVREGRLRMVWNDQTRRETERIVRKVPPLSNEVLEGVFREEDRWPEETHLEWYAFIEDPDDRKFAALAEATGATLVTTDDHLLSVRDRLGIPVQRPEEFAGRECVEE